jgi:hypothetical protein
MKSVNAARFGTLLAAALLYGGIATAQAAQSPVAEFANGSVVRFSTRGHVKSKGAVFSMKVPKSWASLEGERPNIVQKFVSENGKGLEMAMIATKSIPSDVPFSKQDIRDILSADGQREMLPDGATFIAARSSLIEAEPAGVMEYTMRMQRADYDIHMHVLSLTFFQDRTMVQVQFQIGGLPEQRATVERKFVAFRPLFQLMMNSIVFDDKWK